MVVQCFLVSAAQSQGIPGGGPGQGASDCPINDHLAQFPPGWLDHASPPEVEQDWYKVEVLHETLTTVTKKGTWIEEPPYMCAYLPVEEISIPSPSEHTSEVEFKVCFSAGSSLSIQATTALQNILLGELGIVLTAGWTLNAEGCYKKSETYTYFTPRFQCYETVSRSAWVERTLEGEVKTASQRFVWEVSYPSGTQTVVTFCNYQVAVEKVSDTSSVGHQLAPLTNVPITNPDPWDGRRVSRCCEDPPSPADPCCGAEASQ